jgi:hypothetical protein
MQKSKKYKVARNHLSQKKKKKKLGTGLLWIELRACTCWAATLEPLYQHSSLQINKIYKINKHINMYMYIHISFFLCGTGV